MNEIINEDIFDPYEPHDLANPKSELIKKVDSVAELAKIIRS